MSRRRYLSTDAGRDKAVAAVAVAEPHAASFYFLSIPAAGDDCSWGKSDPDELLFDIWPAMARQVDTDAVERWIALLLAHGLWQTAPDGGYRLPPTSFYKYQTYIKDARRGNARTVESDPNDERTTAQPSIDKEGAAHNSAQQRTSAQNAASFSLKDSFRSSLSPHGERPAAPEVRVPEKLKGMHAVLDGLPKYTPTEAFFTKVEQKYGHLDLEEEAIKAREWLATQRSRACSVGFVLNWLGKAAERQAVEPIAPLRRQAPAAPTPPIWTPPAFERSGAPPDLLKRQRVSA